MTFGAAAGVTLQRKPIHARRGQGKMLSEWLRGKRQDLHCSRAAALSKLLQVAKQHSLFFEGGQPHYVRFN